MMLSLKTVGRLGATGLTLLAAVGAVSAAPSPIATTGYTKDVIYAGTTETATGAGKGLDVANYGFDTVSTDSLGLPTSGSFVSTASSGATFQFQSYTANNALVMAKGGTGTITFTTPAAYTAIDVLATQTSAGSTTSGTGFFTYSDNTTSTFTFTALDWGTASTASANSISRYSFSDGTTQYNPFHMYDTALTPTAGKLVKSMTFTANSAGTSADQNTAIFAISGTVVAPEPSQYAALGLGVFGLAGLALKTRRRNMA